MAEAESRSEEPTPHRITEARRHGAVAFSRDLQAGLTALAMCMALILAARTQLSGLLEFWRSSLAQVCSRGDLAEAGRVSLRAMLDVLGIPLGVALIVALVAGVAQTGGLFSPHAFRFDFARILPFSRGRGPGMFWMEMGRTLGKLAVVIGLSWWTVRPALDGLVHLAGVSAGRTLAVWTTLAGTLGLRLAVAAVAFGAGDYLWQRCRHRRSLRMTPEEVRRELREREGDPRLKSARERLRIEFLRQHAVDEVRRATLVIVDGDRVAVALRYDPVEAQAPVVVCKGERLLAARIMQDARQAKVPICFEQALASVLATVEVDDEIPESSHELVARLLATVRA